MNPGSLAAVASLVLFCATGFAFGRSPEYSPEEYFKNYALSACVARAYESEEVTTDASDAAGGFLELGEFAIEAHAEAAELAKEFLAREYVGKRGEKLVFMKCVDFYYSDELEQLAQKYRSMNQVHDPDPPH